MLVTLYDCALHLFSLRFLSGLRMTGTRIGARTSVPVKKALKKKNFANEVIEKETHKHGVCVMGMTSGESSDGQAGDALFGRTPTHKEMSFAQKSYGNLAPRNVGLSIEDIISRVVPIDSSDEETMSSTPSSEDE